MVECLLLVKHETYFDREGINVFSYAVRQCLHVNKPCLVLLGGDDHLGFCHAGEGLVDASDVFCRKGMVVGERKRSQCIVSGIGVNIRLQLPR